jgi:hypothetical protein
VQFGRGLQKLPIRKLHGIDVQFGYDLACHERRFNFYESLIVEKSSQRPQKICSLSESRRARGRAKVV